ncbi:hypothetical protein GCM10009551_063120 [Nocardiopsis tropica]
MRVNLNYFISEAVFDYLVEAVLMVAREGWKLLPDYRFEPETGLWRHRRGAVEPLVRLTDVSYDEQGRMSYPQHDDRAPESALAGYLAEAQAVFAVASPVEAAPAELSADFDHLRWFDLPVDCLEA